MITESQKKYAMFCAVLTLIKRKRKARGESRCFKVYRDRFFKSDVLSVKADWLYLNEMEILRPFCDRSTGYRFKFDIPRGGTKVPASEIPVEILNQIKIMEVTMKLDGVI